MGTMVDTLRAAPYEIRDERVLAVMEAVPRERFVPAHEKRDAYGDFPLPIGYGQTISQPFIVAYMTEQLRTDPSQRVLEVGTGSGYQSAVPGPAGRACVFGGGDPGAGGTGAGDFGGTGGGERDGEMG